MILTLLRHGKARPGSETLADVDRPLDPAGRRDLALMAPIVAESVPDLVLCSAARRTRETLDQIWPALIAADPTHKAPVLFEEALYLAEGDALLSRLRSVPEGTGNVLLVGHNPGISDLALALLPAPGRAKAPGGLTTSGVARFSVVDWSGLQPESAELLAWRTPRALR